MDERRFWANVEPGDGCWLWGGSVRRGYGRYGKRDAAAHRLAYSLAVGDPGDLDVLHLCDTPLCVRPDHLALGTHADNHAQKAARGRGSGGGAPRITREQWEQARARMAEGTTRTQVAADLGVTRQAVVNRIRREQRGSRPAPPAPAPPTRARR